MKIKYLFQEIVVDKQEFKEVEVKYQTVTLYISHCLFTMVINLQKEPSCEWLVNFHDWKTLQSKKLSSLWCKICPETVTIEFFSEEWKCSCLPRKKLIRFFLISLYSNFKLVQKITIKCRFVKTNLVVLPNKNLSSWKLECISKGCSKGIGLWRPLLGFIVFLLLRWPLQIFIFLNNNAKHNFKYTYMHIFKFLTCHYSSGCIIAVTMQIQLRLGLLRRMQPCERTATHNFFGLDHKSTRRLQRSDVSE